MTTTNTAKTVAPKSASGKKPAPKKAAPKKANAAEAALATLRKKFATKMFSLQDIRDAFNTKHGLRRANRLIDAGQLTYVGHNQYHLGGAKKAAAQKSN